MSSLRAGDIWNDMSAALSADLSRLFFIAAPFTLLPVVAIELFGPPAITSIDKVSPDQWLWRLAVPSLLAALAQLAATQLVLSPSAPPGRALARAFAVFPWYILAQMAAALPVGLGVLLLVLPGIYLFGRLVFLAGAVATAEGLAPLAILQRCWALTADLAVPLCLFIIVGLFAMIGISLMADVAGSTLAVVAKAAGLDAVGRFLSALAIGIAQTITAIGAGAASAVAYRRLLA